MDCSSIAIRFTRDRVVVGAERRMSPKRLFWPIARVCAREREREFRLDRSRRRLNRDDARDDDDAIDAVFHVFPNVYAVAF